MASAGRAASAVLAEFGSLSNALGAEYLALHDCAGDAAATALGAAAAFLRQTLTEPLYERPLIADLADLKRYIRHAIGALPNECLMVFYLDAKRHLIWHEVIAEGSNDGVHVDYRRIILKAIARGVHGVILAHNHPSGDPTPSRADVCITRKIATLASEFGITLCDHLVIAGRTTRSALYSG